MVSETNKRPARIPLTPEEVSEFIRFKKHKERVKIQRFKRTSTYKVLNVFNIICIIVYAEIIFAFLCSCNFTKHYVGTQTVFYGKEIKGNVRVFSSAVFKTVYDKEYDVKYIKYFIGTCSFKTCDFNAFLVFFESNKL